MAVQTFSALTSIKPVVIYSSNRYLQGFKTVGPFVVMIYCTIMGDVLQFVSICLVFVMGSPQCKYVRGN
jgi:hypothetical protein